MPSGHRQRSTRKAGSAAARHKWHIVLVAEAHGFDHFALRLWQNDSRRLRAECGQGVRFIGGKLHRFLQDTLFGVDALQRANEVVWFH